MRKKRNLLALLLVFGMVASILSGYQVKADVTKNIEVWFSNDESGGLYLFAHPSQNVVLNYNYTGSFESFKTKVSVVDNGGTAILSETYTNIANNQITVPLPDGEGTYTAIVTITSGTSSVTCKAQIEAINGLPNITSQPQSVTTELQKAVSFHVAAEEGATYQWYRTRSINKEGEEISGGAAQTLTITDENVAASTNGTYYYCKVTSNEKTIISNYARLLINGVSLPTATPDQDPDAPTATPGTETNTPDPDSTPGSNEIVINTETPAPTTPPQPTSKAENTDSAKDTPRPNPVIAPTVRYDSFTITGKYNASKNRIEFTWGKLDSSLTFVSISRSNTRSGTYKDLGTPTTTSYNDTSVLPNKTYYYKVAYLKKENNIYTYYLSNICAIKTKPNPTVKKFKAKKKGRKLLLSWEYGMYANRVAVYIKSGKKWTKVGTTLKKNCKMTIPLGYKKVKARVRPYNLIKGKKYYGKYSKTLQVNFRR